MAQVKTPAPGEIGEVEQLRAEVKALEENLADIHRRLDALENLRAQPSAATVAVATLPRVEVQPIAQPAPAASVSAALIHPSASAIATEQPADGSFLIPNTEARVRFGGYARVEIIHDFQPAGFPTAFIPSSIPIPGLVSPTDTRADINQSFFRAELWRPTRLGQLHIYYANDLFGGSTTTPVYHLSGIYGELGRVLAGYTTSAFLDPDAVPETLDYQGPNGNPSARAAQVRFTQPLTSRQSFAVGVEGALIDVQTNLEAVSTSPIPDFTAHYRYVAPHGHLQVAGVFRDIETTLGGLLQQHALGWGTTVGGSHTLFRRDVAQGQGYYGHGVAHYISGLSGNSADLGLGLDAKLNALPTIGGYGGYLHYWSRNLRSTGTYGYVRISNSAGQDEMAFHSSQYIAGNLIWSVRDGISAGTEFIHGTNVSHDHAEVKANRLQLTIQYNLFAPNAK